MKLILATIACLLLIVGLPLQVMAQGNSQNARNSEQFTTQSNETAEDEATTTDVETDAKAEKRAERLARYKERLEARLTAAEGRSIRTTCKPAQVQVKVLAKNVGQVKTIRENAYLKLLEKLEQIVQKAGAANLDTTLVEATVESMQGEVEIYLTAIEDYQTMVDDLGALDCEDDPEAFKAALESSKEQRVALLSSSQSLRLYLNESIRPALLGLREQLSGDEDDSEELEQEPSETDNEDTVGETNDEEETTGVNEEEPVTTPVEEQ